MVCNKVRILDDPNDTSTVHMEGTLGDFNSLCGWVNVLYEYVDSDEKITCEACIAIIEHCKTVKRSEYSKAKRRKEGKGDE